VLDGAGLELLTVFLLLLPLWDRDRRRDLVNRRTTWRRERSEELWASDFGRQREQTNQNLKFHFYLFCFGVEGNCNIIPELLYIIKYILNLNWKTLLGNKVEIEKMREKRERIWKEREFERQSLFVCFFVLKVFFLINFFYLNYIFNNFRSF
jgi:hypothetical protein